MKNQIRLEFLNGDVFLLPVEVIAKMRTAYYADLDGFVEGSQEWKEEMEQSMNGYEVTDWLSNNVDWSDIKDFAVKQPTDEFDYDKGWSSVDVEIV